MRRAVGPTALIYEWLEAHSDGERWDALLAWIRAVAVDPDMVTSGRFVKGRRVVHFAHIPRARTRASFIVVDVPALAIHLVELDDDKYEEP